MILFSPSLIEFSDFPSTVPMRPDLQRSAGYPCKENICFHGGTCMLIPDLYQFYCK